MSITEALFGVEFQSLRERYIAKTILHSLISSNRTLSELANVVEESGYYKHDIMPVVVKLMNQDLLFLNKGTYVLRQGIFGLN